MGSGQLSAENKIAQFMFALYGIKAKEARSRLSKILRRLNFSGNRRAEAEMLCREVNASFSFNGANDVKEETIKELQELIRAYGIDICRIIGSDSDANLENIRRIKERTAQFIHEWNWAVAVLENAFLPIYGNVYPVPFLLLDAGTVASVFASFKRFRNIPRQLQIITNKHIINVIGRSMEFDNACSTIRRTQPK